MGEIGKLIKGTTLRGWEAPVGLVQLVRGISLCTTREALFILNDKQT